MSSDLLKRKRKLSTGKDSKSELSEEEFDEDEEEYEVEAILDKRVDKRKGGLFYLIKWKNWSDKHNSWEPFSNLDNCLDLLEKFEFEYANVKNNNNNNNNKGKSNKLKKKSQGEEVQEKEKVKFSFKEFINFFSRVTVGKGIILI